MKDTECTEMGNIYISSEQIIQEVQKFRCLYDPSDPDHKDRDIMRDAWLSVTSAVVGEPWANLNSAEKNEAAEEAERKWRNVRDSIRKSLKSSEKARRPGMVCNELTSPSEEDHSGSVIDCVDDTSGALEADDLSETSDSRTATRSPNPKRKKHKPRQIIQTRKEENKFEREQSPVLVPYNTCVPEVNSFSGANYPCYQSTCMPERENPDRMFLLSLLPRLSALSSRKKLDFQIKTIQMLRRYEKDDSNS